MGGAGYLGLAFGCEARHHERRAGSDVVRPDGRSGEALGAAHHRVMAFGADVGAHAPQLVDVAESAGEDVLGDDPDARRRGEHGHQERLVVGGKAGVRQGGHVGGGEALRCRGPDAVGVGDDVHAHLGQLADEHGHVVGHCVAQEHRPAAHAHSGQVGSGLDAVRDHPVAGLVRMGAVAAAGRARRRASAVVDDTSRYTDAARCAGGRAGQTLACGRQPLDAFDDQTVPGPTRVGAHLVEEAHQVADLGLAGGVVDQRAALGAHRRHQHVLGCAHRRILQHHLGAGEHLGRARDVAVRRTEGGAQALQRTQMHVDRARAEVVAARQRHTGGAEARQQRAQHRNGRPHPLHEVIRRLGADLSRHIDDQTVIGARDADAHRFEQIAHERHVGDVGHVRQHMPALGQQAGRHQLQHAVLGAADAHLAVEAAVAPHQDHVARRLRHRISSTTSAGAWRDPIHAR